MKTAEEILERALGTSDWPPADGMYWDRKHVLELIRTGQIDALQEAAKIAEKLESTSRGLLSDYMRARRDTARFIKDKICSLIPKENQ